MSPADYPAAPTGRPNCGTYAGVQQHNRHGERCCRPCLDALNRLHEGVPAPWTVWGRSRLAAWPERSGTTPVPEGAATVSDARA